MRSPGQQRTHSREPSDEIVDRKDQLARTPDLELLAVEGRGEANVVAVGELVRSHRHRPGRTEPRVRLRERELGRRAGELEDAFGDVLATGDAGDGVPRGGAVDLEATATDDRNDLDLPVHVALGQSDGRSTGPVMHVGNLVKTRGCSGGVNPASAACGR